MKNQKLTIEEIERFETNPRVGLDATQVELRKKQKLTNKSTIKTGKSYFMIIVTNLFTFFNMLCLGVFFALLILVGNFSQVLFMVIISANIIIGIVQEIRAKRTMDKISLMTAPITIVTRDGVAHEIPTEKVVLDDILTFNLGKQICTDSIIVEGDVDVNESLLTGESDAVKKGVGDLLLAGSFVVAGSCIARAERVGNMNYTSSLAKKAKALKKPQSEILRTLKIVIYSIGVVILPLAIFTFLKLFLWSSIPLDPVTGLPVDPFIHSVSGTGGSIIGMIPAGMFLLTSLALFVGILKLFKRRTSVKDLYGIEMLARTDVLCLDKTGTITDGKMKVKEIIKLNKVTDDEISDYVSYIVGNLGGQNATSLALAEHFGGKAKKEACAKIEFNSAKKCSAVTIDTTTYILGAPEFIAKLTQDEKAIIDKHVKNGSRVILLASAQGKIDKDGNIPEKITDLAFIVIEENIKPDAIETIKWFNENNVNIKIISGDNATAVSAISTRVGIVDAHKFVSLEGKTDEEVYELARHNNVFGRVSPEQKAIIIKSLKDNGHKVAMTGDGVNDLLALKEADCSIAMASGSDAARNVSSLVMLDSNFGSMPSVVAEGRRVINNISKSSSLFLMKTFFVIFLTITSYFLASGYPFNTSNLLLLEFFVIGIPSFALALQVNKERISGDFLTNLTINSFPGALTIFFNVALALLLNNLLSWTDAEFNTIGTLIITITGFVILFKLCLPFNKYRAIMFSVVLSAAILAISLIFAIPFLREDFNFAMLDFYHIIFVSVITVTSLPLYLLFNWLIRLVFRKKKKAEVVATTT
jgi:cation-transporting ATPase E